MATPLQHVVGFDIGGTKTAWGLVSEEGTLTAQDIFLTPQEPEELLKQITEVVTAHHPAGVGIGVAGTITRNRERTILCPNIPKLSQTPIVALLRERLGLPVTLDNDARCALIGEVWQGAAQDTSSAVMLTLGTGVGGAVMQKEVVLPHPEDITREISHLIALPDDLLPAQSGRGSIEALLGGKNLAQRFGMPVESTIEQAEAGDKEATDIVHTISYYLIEVLRTIHRTYTCKRIIIGGKGARNLPLYLRDEPPCPVVPAKLGEMAGVYGAARLALDLLENQSEEDAEWSPTV